MKKDKSLLEKAVKLADPNTIATEAERNELLNQLQKAIAEDDSPKWWITLLKIIAYAIGLILAGYGTTTAALVLCKGVLF